MKTKAIGPTSSRIAAAVQDGIIGWRRVEYAPQRSHQKRQAMRSGSRAMLTFAHARQSWCPQAGHSNQWKRHFLNPAGMAIQALMTRTGLPAIQAARFSTVSL